MVIDLKFETSDISLLTDTTSRLSHIIHNFTQKSREKSKFRSMVKIKLMTRKNKNCFSATYELTWGRCGSGRRKLFRIPIIFSYCLCNRCNSNKSSEIDRREWLVGGRPKVKLKLTREKLWISCISRWKKYNSIFFLPFSNDCTFLLWVFRNRREIWF